jgi:glutathione synthase/RimK-type ligase-like ATP-grasp enzyme
VLKPIRGTGGNGVYRATNCKEVESSILDLFQKDYGLVVSPYINIAREIRVVVLNSEIRLIYEKKRPSVTGDGKSTVIELAVSSSKSVARSMSPTELARIPSIGEQVPIEWRHNLGHGAEPIIMTDDLRMPEIHDMALRACLAVGIRFCSVDIIEDEKDGKLMVLEINAGVMMDSFITAGDTQRNIAKSIYTDAIISSLSMG